MKIVETYGFNCKCFSHNEIKKHDEIVIVNCIEEIELSNEDYDNFFKTECENGETRICKKLNDFLESDLKPKSDYDYVIVIRSKGKQSLAIDTQGYDYPRYVAVVKEI